MMAVDAKGSSTWRQAPNPLERPLKAGWLKKQRSIVKNWQQRYFVLKGQHLLYYKEEEDLKPQGSLQLQGCTIREVASGSEEAGKFIFEIIPVVFGQQLGDTMMYEQRFGQHLVPILVEKCAEFIRKKGLDEEGVFRLPGQDNLYEDFLQCGQLLTFLHEVQQSSDTNKMSVENLATVFGVNLIRPQIEDPVTIMRGTPQIQKVMTTMISDHEKLFPGAKDTQPSPPPSESSSKKAPVLRSSKDDLEASSSKLSDGSAPSAVDQGEAPSRDGLETQAMRKRTQTLPNRKCMESFSSNRRHKNIDRSDIFSSNFWSSSSSSSSSMVQPSPNSPSGGHRRTLSQGISKLFSFTQPSNSGSLCTLEQGAPSEADHSSSGQLGDDFGTCLQANDPPRAKENGATILELPLEKENFEVWTKVVRLKKEIEEEKTKLAELDSELQNLKSSRKVNEENQPHKDSLESAGQVPTGTEQRTECANQL
ncbi:Rho GTPase-activating protein 25, partial [Ophiophagus hannah]